LQEQQNQPTNPQNPLRARGGQGASHAEGDVANQVSADIEELMREGLLTEADLDGKTIVIAVEQTPCSACRSRHAMTATRLNETPLQPNQVAWTSAVVQLSYWYPRTVVRVVFPGGEWKLLGGRVIN
jgi:hypothetical protein